MHHTRDTLNVAARTRSSDILNRHLAAAIDLHAQVKHAHWNVRGPNFIAIHELFDKIAGRVESYTDTIAERAATLGGTARGTVQTAAAQSFLVPYAVDVADEKLHLFAVASAIAAYGTSVRAAIAEAAGIDDPVTTDVLTEISRGLDFDLWLLEAHSPPETHDMATAPLAAARTRSK